MLELIHNIQAIFKLKELRVFQVLPEYGDFLRKKELIRTDLRVAKFS